MFLAFIGSIDTKITNCMMVLLDASQWDIMLKKEKSHYGSMLLTDNLLGSLLLIKCRATGATMPTVAVFLGVD